jgi:hypothetical protein
VVKEVQLQRTTGPGSELIDERRFGNGVVFLRYSTRS